jgi:hypothetical protein
MHHVLMSQRLQRCIKQAQTWATGLDRTVNEPMSQSSASIDKQTRHNSQDLSVPTHCEVQLVQSRTEVACSANSKVGPVLN